MEEQSDVRKREVYWRTRLQPYSYVLAFVWTTLTFQQSHTAGLAVYAAAFTVLLGSTLMDGSFVYHLGLLLLLSALCYGLLAVGVRSRSFRLRGALTFDESAVLRTMCTHLALLDRLVLAGVTKLTSLRSQQPMWFYVSGTVVVFVMGRLGQWFSFMALLWMAGLLGLSLQLSIIHFLPSHFSPIVSVVLILPAALSRGWVSVPTSETVGGTLYGMVRSLQRSLSTFSPS